MCGIAGVYTIGGPRTAAEWAVPLAQIAHRGPDGEGTWSEDPPIWLGHRRLAIVDLSQDGAQPMASSDGRWVLSFNGEVYGFRDLRSRLEGLGHRFKSTSDTEVLVEAIAEWGVEKALAHTNGMYAISVWDRQEQELWLARDPIGEKPLYVWEPGDRVVFASELGVLRTAAGFSAEIDPTAVATYFQLGYVPAPLSIYRRVSKLEAGEWRRYRGRTVTTGRTAHALPEAPPAADLFDVLADAVAIRTVADVPVGVFLSGGIDSTLIAGLAARAGPTHTFTATFGQRSHDESVPAARVAEALGTIHTELPITAADGLALSAALPRIYGEPFGDPSAIPTHLIAAEAKNHVGVALTGDGGDELFGGYNRLAQGIRLERFRHRTPAVLRRATGAGLHRLGPRRIERIAAGAARAMGRPPVPNVADKVDKIAATLGAASTADAVRQLVAMWPDPKVLVADAHPIDLGIGDGDFDEELLELDRRLTLPEQMLTKVDRATMAVALEARPPLLDPRIVAIARAASLRDHLNGGLGKQMLRRLVPALIDPALLDRPKMGFDPPVASWLRGPLRSWADDLLAPEALGESGITGTAEVARLWRHHLDGGTGAEYRLWTLLQYQQWHRSEHQLRAAPAPVPARVRARSKGIDLRPATVEDQPQVLCLVAAAMGTDADDPRFGWLLRWKHQDNPFGPSPAWVATSGDEIVGYRAFLRWEFTGLGRSWRAVRAVDTATHPQHQGKGIFRSLTMHALEELQEEGIDFVFNTPNDQSRPGYLKMGWQLVDHLTPWIRPASIGSLPRIARGRTPAGIWGEPDAPGLRAVEVLEPATVAALLEPPDDDRIRTSRSAEYLRWRYPAEHLGYRVLPLGSDLAEGVACYRLRRRGDAIEATIGDLLVPGGDPVLRRRLIGHVAKTSGADYVLVLDGGPSDHLVPLPSQGPTLVWRHVCWSEVPPADAWHLTMGDIELF